MIFVVVLLMSIAPVEPSEYAKPKRIIPGIRVKEWDSADICTKCICIIKERRIEEEKKNETKD